MRRVIFVLLAAGSCSIENGVLVNYDHPERLDPADGCLVVEPGVVWFGEVVVGEDEPITEVLTVSNPCEGPLGILPLEQDPSSPFITEIVGDPWVEPGGSATIDVTFDPATAYAGTTWLSVASTAGSIPVDLRARGLAPVLVTDPSVEVRAPTGCTVTQPITVTNSGSADLEIFAVELEPASGDLAIGLVEPRTLAPGKSLDIPLEYTARLSETARLRIDSTDPLTPLVEVLVRASAAGDDLFTEAHDVPVGGKVDVVWTLDRSG